MAPVQPTVYVLCPDIAEPRGGTRKLYRHVDVLNRHGFPAWIIHQQKGFRLTWFANETAVACASERSAGPDDYVVLPEIWGPKMGGIAPGIKKVILNQNAYYTFSGYGLEMSDLETPYEHPEVVATITVSEDSLDYLSHTFPRHRILRMRYSINPELYYPGTPKKPVITFMPRKQLADLTQVLTILKFRRALHGFEVLPIHNRSETEAAALLRESAVFLSFSGIEGFGLPPAEAMACGCITIGYHGNGGREFFRAEFAYPIETGDVLGFARTVERVLDQYRQDPAQFQARTEAAARFIRERYTPEQEEADIVACWRTILAAAGDAVP